MTGMLASVNSLEEAMQAMGANVDIIDLKQPSAGALGALDHSTVTQIVGAIRGRCPVSATVGDLPMRPEIVYPAVEAMAQTGVDYIKIGFFPNGDWQSTINKLAELSDSTTLIAVLFADIQPDLTVVGKLKNAGFKGVMLDTVDKRKGSLTEVMDKRTIEKFIRYAKEENLLTGLAGSLRLEDIVDLMPFQPNYLGFRGALCLEHERTGHLNKWAVIQIKKAIERCAEYQTTASTEIAPRPKEKRVVIADDNEINRLILANMLEMNGYIVDAAENGKQALEFIGTNHYRFALIDLSMPVMSGLEMIKVLRERQNPLKVAAISTFADYKQKAEALAAGFDYCLTKPVGEDQLVALLNLR